MSKLNVNYLSYPLILKHSFNLACGKRNATPCVLLKLEFENFISYGEASLPPYLKENPESVISYFESIDWNVFNESAPFDFLDYLNSLENINYPAMAAIDMAIHDLAGKLKHIPCHEMLHIEKKSTPLISYTISYDEDENYVLQKLNAANDFMLLKLKLGTANDKRFIDFILKHTHKPFFADVNQGWKSLQEGIYMAEFLKERNCLFIEQPFAKDAYTLSYELKKKNILPVLADESIADINDLKLHYSCFDGINIKLMKCGGIKNALQMIAFARKMNLITMMGCMTETSYGIAAASQIAPLCDYADLDGTHLISNNPFKEVEIVNGTILLQKKSGIGVERGLFPIPEDF